MRENPGSQHRSYPADCLVLVDIRADVLLKTSVDELRAHDFVFGEEEKHDAHGNAHQGKHAAGICVAHKNQKLQRRGQMAK